MPHQTGRVKEESVRWHLGGRGGWGYRVHSTVHMYSIICTINSIRGRGKGKLSYKLALAQLLQLLVLAIQIIDTIFYLYLEFLDVFFHGSGFSGLHPDFWPIRIETQEKSRFFIRVFYGSGLDFFFS